MSFRIAFALFLFISGIEVSLGQSMQPDSVLDGHVTRKTLERYFPWFKERYIKYQPNDSTITLIKTYSKKVSFIVVMGSWCSDTREHVPSFFKVLDKAGVAEKKVDMIAVNRKKKSLFVDVAPYRVEYVPTFIVFYKDKEIGRIVEDTKVNMEKDLLKILVGK